MQFLHNQHILHRPCLLGFSQKNSHRCLVCLRPTGKQNRELWTVQLSLAPLEGAVFHLWFQRKEKICIQHLQFECCFVFLPAFSFMSFIYYVKAKFACFWWFWRNYANRKPVWAVCISSEHISHTFIIPEDMEPYSCLVNVLLCLCSLKLQGGLSGTPSGCLPSC